MTVDNKTKRMTVTRRTARSIKTIPVSLGKKSTPSSSGTMVVIEKLRKTVFDTIDELGPEDGLPHQDRLRPAPHLGRRVHPRRALVGGRAGQRNVSHGCVNVSMANGEWLFKQTQIGDPITVKGTERKLQNGNGWTDWNMSWDEYVKGSALPYEPRGRPGRHRRRPRTATVTPSTTPTARRPDTTRSPLSGALAGLRGIAPDRRPDNDSGPLRGGGLTWSRTRLG